MLLIRSTKTLVVYNWLKYKSYFYKKGLFIVTGSEDKIVPDFKEIFYIIKINEEFYFVLKSWFTTGFNGHVHSYCIEETDNWTLIDVKHLSTLGPFHKITSPKDGGFYIMYYN